MRLSDLYDIFWGCFLVILCLICHAAWPWMTLSGVTPLHVFILLSMERHNVPLTVSLALLGGVVYDLLWLRPYELWIAELIFLGLLGYFFQRVFRPTFWTRALFFAISFAGLGLYHGYTRTFCQSSLFLYTMVSLWLMYHAWKTRIRLVTA